MTGNDLRLSVIDIGWPGHIPILSSELDRLGYHRFWATEHHNENQSASPVVMAAIVASRTKRLRVGTAGVLINYQSPLKIAEDFSLLEYFFPGRIDLGIVGASASQCVGASLLDGRDSPTRDTFAHKAGLLAGHLKRGRTAPDSQRGHRFQFGCEGCPEFWICGHSQRSAVLAGQLGARYSFHHYLSSNDPDRHQEGHEIVAAYVSSFVPSRYLRAPEFNVAVYGLCMEDDEAARDRWSTRHPTLRPSFLGSPEHCRKDLIDIRDIYGANELVIQCITPFVSEKVKAYRMIAGAFGLSDGAPLGSDDSRIVASPEIHLDSEEKKTCRISFNGETFTLNQTFGDVLKYLLNRPPVLFNDLYCTFSSEISKEKLSEFIDRLVTQGMVEIF
jgi:alkanesulfonate monooxygenase SsuD/methylene tetrahydromethanopterin reductase-like flavin-dependent oxidoreductase (luciferase family)